MPHDDTPQVAAAIGADLDPGERVLLATRMDLTAGSDRSAPPVRPVSADERGTARRGAETAAGVVGALATNNSPVNFKGPDVDRWLNGVGITGPAGSTAQATAALLKSSDRTFLVLTDRRLLAVVDRHGYQVTGAVPRARLREVRRRPKLLFRGRVVLTFVDGSTLALQTGPPFGASLADRFVDAAAGQA